MNQLSSTTDRWFGKTLEKHNNEINQAFLREYCEYLEQKPVLDPAGWGFLGLFAQDFPMEFRIELQGHLDAFIALNKPYGCELCGEKEATKYHILAGKVCLDCFMTLPVGD